MTKIQANYQSIKDLVQMAKDQNRPDLAVGLLEDAISSLYEAYLLACTDLDIANKRLLDYSWQTNPDRMGGCFSEDERSNTGWK